MIRKLVLPILAAALLGGCVTDYAYRGGDRGDYYYGQPSTEYRYYGPYGGYAPYGGFAPYGYGGFNFGGTYGYPYRYYGYPYGYGGFYNHPYYRPYYRRPAVTGPGVPQHRGDGRRPPWRDLDGLRRRPTADGGSREQPREVVPTGPVAEPRERGLRPEPAARRSLREGRRQATDQEP
jgi:hypothetical protein